MVALTAVMPRAARGRPVNVVLTEAKEKMQQMVALGRDASRSCGEEKRQELEHLARVKHAEAVRAVDDLRRAVRGCRALIVERYARNGGRVRIEMSDFPTISSGCVDVSAPSGTTWGELAAKEVKIPLCHIRSIQVVQ